MSRFRLKAERRRTKFRSLEVREASSSHLKPDDFGNLSGFEAFQNSYLEFAAARCESTSRVCLNLEGLPTVTECHWLSFKLCGQLSFMLMDP